MCSSFFHSHNPLVREEQSRHHLHLTNTYLMPLGARLCFSTVQLTDSLTSHTSPRRWVLLSLLLYRWGHWGKKWFLWLGASKMQSWDTNPGSVAVTAPHSWDCLLSLAFDNWGNWVQGHEVIGQDCTESPMSLHLVFFHYITYLPSLFPLRVHIPHR